MAEPRQRVTRTVRSDADICIDIGEVKPGVGRRRQISVTHPGGLCVRINEYFPPDGADESEPVETDGL